MRVLDVIEARPHGLVPSFFLRPGAPAPRRKGNRGLANGFPTGSVPRHGTEDERHRQPAADRAVRVARAATRAIFPPDLRRARHVEHRQWLRDTAFLRHSVTLDCRHDSM